MLVANSNLKFFAKIILSVSLLYYFYSKTEFKDLYSIISNISIKTILYIFLLQFFLTLIMSKRYNVIVNEKFIFFKIFILNNKINFYNLFVPAKLGELAKIEFLKNIKSYEKKHSIHLILYERFIDLLILVSLTVFMGFGVYCFNFDINLIIYFFILTINFILFIFLFYIDKIDLILSSYIKIIKFLNEEINYFLNLKKNYIKNQKITFYTLIFWLISYLQFYLMTLEFDYINFLLNSYLISLIILISLIPISISGIGVRETAYLFFFKDIIGYENSLILAGIFFISRILFPAVCGLFFFKINS